MTSTKNKLPFKEKFGYGIGTLSYGIPFQLMSACFVFYSTAVLGISGTITGILVSVSIIWDAITDPIMGYISDQTNNNILFGRRLFYVFLGAIGIAICNFFLWSVDPHLPYIVKVIYLTILLLLLKTFSTVLTTPHMALGAELSNDYAERTSVQSFRTAFFFFGFMFPTIIGMTIFFRPTSTFLNGQLNPVAYTSLGITASAITLVCAAICILLTYNKSINPKTVKKRKSTFRNMIRETAEALKCNDFRNVGLGLLFINTAMSIVGSIGMHVFTYTFNFSNRQIAVVFGTLFMMALLAQPFWVFFANKFEKRAALKACLYIDIAVSLLFAIFVLINEWVADHYLSVLPLAFLMGISMGGSISLPYSMISDTIDKDAYKTGIRKEGVFFGCATFLFKVSQALSVLFAGTLLDMIHFDSNIVQTRDVYLKLGLILPVGFLVCFSLALFFISKYSLNRQMVAIYQGCFDKEQSE
ncbi:MAG: MFS transporter [Christensenellales bacterium]|jgi:GPH family glycoside/pentoside/hexuronide:cation symporter